MGGGRVSCTVLQIGQNYSLDTRVEIAKTATGVNQTGCRALLHELVSKRVDRHTFFAITYCCIAIYERAIRAFS